MKKDFIQEQDMKLRMKHRMLLRAFFINLILGVIALALTYFPILLYVAVWATGISPMVMYFSIIGGIAFWQMLGVVLFLVPGISAWMERRSLANY
ncbi:MAG: hypothetical protein K2I81_02545 [Alphaproteobacteria bacterium]|nr:hypothetical protein [Alphaproteobacteria bacterium]MDE6481997.1 hypothetical protein [Alphaproteobacteria bacterium]